MPALVPRAPLASDAPAPATDAPAAALCLSSVIRAGLGALEAPRPRFPTGGRRRAGILESLLVLLCQVLKWGTATVLTGAPVGHIIARPHSTQAVADAHP